MSKHMEVVWLYSGGMVVVQCHGGDGMVVAWGWHGGGIEGKWLWHVNSTLIDHCHAAV